MPRQTTCITDKRLLAELDELPASLKITEKQAALILGIAAETLRWKRRQQDQKVKEAAQGKAVSDMDLLPVQQAASRHAVRYKLGDVRRAANRDTHVGQSARNAAQARREEGWMGFGSWLANANIDDTWTFTIQGGVLMDFATSLALADNSDWEEGSEEFAELTLGDYLEKRKEVSLRSRASALAEALDEVTGGVDSERLCPSCGGSFHSGHCRF